MTPIDVRTRWTYGSYKLDMCQKGVSFHYIVLNRGIGYHQRGRNFINILIYIWSRFRLMQYFVHTLCSTLLPDNDKACVIGSKLFAHITVSYEAIKTADWCYIKLIASHQWKQILNYHSKALGRCNAFISSSSIYFSFLNQSIKYRNQNVYFIFWYILHIIF